MISWETVKYFATTFLSSTSKSVYKLNEVSEDILIEIMHDPSDHGFVFVFSPPAPGYFPLTMF